MDDWLLEDDRKQMYLTNEAAGLMPLACTRTVNSKGLELEMPPIVGQEAKRSILIL